MFKMFSTNRSQMANRWLQLGALAFVMSACVSETVIGTETADDDLIGGDGDGDNIASKDWGNEFGDLAGSRWEGYYEEGAGVTLMLRADGTGIFFLGEEPAEIGPPTDPDVGYLCFGDNSTPGDECWPEEFREGLGYPIKGTSLRGRRLEFQVALSELWDDWCVLQTPQIWQDDDNGTYYAIGPLIGSSSGESDCYLGAHGEGKNVDCGWLFLVDEEVCECDASECTANSNSESFDLTANEEFTEFSNVEGLHLFRVE